MLQLPAPSSQTLLGPQESCPHFPPRRLPAAWLEEDPVLPSVLPLLGPLLQEGLRAVTTPSLAPHHKNPLSWCSTNFSVAPRAGQCLFRVLVRGPRGGHVVSLALILPAYSCLLSPSEKGRFHQTLTPALPAQRVAKSGKAGVWGLWEEDKSRSTPALWHVCLPGQWEETLGSSGMPVPGAPGSRNVLSSRVSSA